jgi:Flp pilus assembly protein TadG
MKLSEPDWRIVFSGAVLVFVALCVLPAPSIAAEPATVSSGGPSSATSGDTITISINLTNTGSSEENYIADVSLPRGWSVDSHSDDGGQWNSGDRSWLWQNIDSKASVTPSISVVIPNDEPSGSYSVEAVAKTDEGTADSATHIITVDNPNDGGDEEENDGSDGSGGGSNAGGGGGSTGGNGAGGGTTDDQTTDEQSDDSESDESEEPADEASNQVAEEIRKTKPSTQTVVDIVDTDPERAGVTIDTEQSQSVDEVTFDDESVTGTVETKEYDTLTKTTTDQIATAVLEKEAADNDASEASSTESQTESDSRQTATSVNVVSVTDISPTYESDAGTSATVTLSVDRTDLNDPTNAFVIHETANGWEKLETTVEETADDKVTLEAHTDSFSLFAVVETEEQTQSQTSSQETQPASESGDSSVPTLPAVGGVVAIVLLSALLSRWRRSQ